MNERLSQSDFEDLSAWLDGELPTGRAAEVEQRVRQDSAWREACEDLRSLDAMLDDFRVPSPSADLAARVLAAIPTRELTDSEAEDLSAWLDGELPAEQAGLVASAVERDANWRQTQRDFADIDALLDAYTAPDFSAELTERIMVAVRKQARRRQVWRAVSWLAPAAAAAAILMVGLAVYNGSPRHAGPQGPRAGAHPAAIAPAIEPELAKSAAFQVVPANERPALQEEIIRHLNFFRDYEVVADFETLQAIDTLESGKGT